MNADFLGRIGSIFSGAGLSVLFPCPLILVWQFCSWLRLGWWPSIYIRHLGHGTNDILAHGGLIDWAADLPLVPITVCIGAVLLGAGRALLAVGRNVKYAADRAASG